MSVTRTKQTAKLPGRRRTKTAEPETVAAVQNRNKPAEPQAAAPAQSPSRPVRPNPDFERELQDHFAAEARKKLEEATENIFGSVLARHGWVRNEHGQVEYVGEGA